MHAQIQDLHRRYQRLLRERAPWDEAWRQLSRHFLPMRYRAAQDAARVNKPMLNRDMVDATGIFALRTLAAGMQGGMTSPARPWFRLAPDDADLTGSRAARLWLDTVTERMRIVFHRSNFYNAMHALYAELGAFGTGLLYELADERGGFRFITCTAGTYVLDCDEQERVDTVFRRVFMTARQLRLAYGRECLPERLPDAWNAGGEERYAVINAVFPRQERNPRRLDAPHMPWASISWLEGCEGQTLPLRESGFVSFPAFGPRWDVLQGDVYGHSPAMDALPDCRMLQQMGISTLKAIHKSVEPPMSVSAALKNAGLDLTAGGINYVETMQGQSPLAATPLLQIKPEIAQARAAMESVQNQIKTGLYNDLFRIILNGRNNVTATEIAAREEEKIILMGPTLERLHSELFIPLIDRTFMLMLRLNMLPPCPPELCGQRLKVEFVSLLAQAQKLVCTGAVDQYVNFTATAGRIWPEATDAVDIDALMDKYAEYLGLEIALLRPQEERNLLRDARRLQCLQQPSA